MPVRVADASAVAAVLFHEPEADEVESRLRGYRLSAPALLTYELANVCWKKSLRRPHERSGFRRALARLPQLGIHLTPVSASSMVTLALETDLSAYDASYLWLTLEMGAPLVTLDRKLANVARALLGRNG